MTGTSHDAYGRTEIDERFDTGALNEDVWTAAYLPAWSSMREAAATYTLDGSGLRLSIPPDQPLWCPDRHDGPLRVSAVQSGNWSGPVGSTRGQQPFRDGLVVREAQPTRWGLTPHYGHVEVQCRVTLTARSMFSAWLVGLEDEPERCGEICIVEVFGDKLTTGEGGRPVAALGCGIHAFRDPRLVEAFSADPYPIDVGTDHRYAVDWQPGRVDFLVDDMPVKTVHQAPDYPMQLILGVFDFPDRAPAGQIEVPVPELVVRRVLAHRGTVTRLPAGVRSMDRNVQAGRSAADLDIGIRRGRTDRGS
jgi:glycosyl hydrolase family 16